MALKRKKRKKECKSECSAWICPYYSLSLECFIAINTWLFFLSHPYVTVTLLTIFKLVPLTFLPALYASAAENNLNSFVKHETFYFLRCQAYSTLQFKESHWDFQPLKVTDKIIHSCSPPTLAKSWGWGQSRSFKVAQERRKEAAASFHLPDPIPPEGTQVQGTRPALMPSVGHFSASHYQIPCLQTKS